jgi:LysR family nitrogen assimilation transcriptional regulator
LVLEFRQLRYFVAIVENGSLSKAALVLGIAQPALSQHVRRMEDELRVPLLNRTPRGVMATDAGERLYRSARGVLAQVAEIPDFVRGAVTNPTGEVRFGMSGTVSELVAVPLINLARERYPGIRIRLVEAMSGHVLEWLKKGDVDVALVYATSDPKGLATEHVLTENLCLFGKPGGPMDFPSASTVTLAQALAMDLVMPGPSHGLRKLVEDAAVLTGLSVNAVLEVDSYNQIKGLTRQGAGYGILPETAVAAEVAQGIFHFWRIGPAQLKRNIYLTHSTERPLSSAVQAISALSLEVTRRLVTDEVWIADVPAHA